ncbi:hypothetical protein E4U42_007033 [Claviceps africana]|uniref:Uncharacterized protein n=1 Tax=Claviceps africana TaxID=83212 RepID=A0A8K0NK59_9HYPO|nr:hypothetical protein E4U42_007033 [Claviceps africana]
MEPALASETARAAEATPTTADMPRPAAQRSRPRLLAVALYHRDHISLPPKSRCYGYEAFHWGLLITPSEAQAQPREETSQAEKWQPSGEKNCLAVDATDASEIDPITFRMKNPSMDWWMHHKVVDPETSSKMIGRIVVGEIPPEVSNDDLMTIFHRVPLPVKNTHPQQSCVTWAISAVRYMQNLGWARKFDLDQFKDAALAYAEERMKKEESTEPKIKYYKTSD